MRTEITKINKQDIIVEDWSLWNHNLSGEYRIKVSQKGISISETKKCTSFPRSNELVIDILRDLIDLDHWKYSIHMNISDVIHDDETMKSVKNIIEDKINQRQHEIDSLKFGLKLLRKRKSIEYNIDKFKE